MRHSTKIFSPWQFLSNKVASRQPGRTKKSHSNPNLESNCEVPKWHETQYSGWPYKRSPHWCNHPSENYLAPIFGHGSGFFWHVRTHAWGKLSKAAIFSSRFPAFFCPRGLVGDTLLRRRVNSSSPKNGVYIKLTLKRASYAALSLLFFT